MIEEGSVLERGGVLVLARHGRPAAAVRDGASSRARRPRMGGDGRVAGAASAQSVRADGAPERALFRRVEGRAREPVWWFGGGMDLTPYYGFDEDAVHFHRTCRDALAPFGDDVHAAVQEVVRRVLLSSSTGSEPRGIGGIFFDDLNEGGFDRCFALTRSVGDHFLPPTCRSSSAARTRRTASASAISRLYRRGRYVEFNLVWDRGTLFGLQSQRAHRGDPDVDAAARALALRLDAANPARPRRRLYSDFLVAKDWH